VPIKIVAGGLVGGPQKLAKASEKFDFGGRQHCVVKDRDHFKSQRSQLVWIFFFFVCFLVPFTELFGQTQAFYKVLRSTPKEAFPDIF
jgi:hypothetical protein